MGRKRSDSSPTLRPSKQWQPLYWPEWLAAMRNQWIPLHSPKQPAHPPEWQAQMFSEDYDTAVKQETDRKDEWCRAVTEALTSPSSLVAQRLAALIEPAPVSPPKRMTGEALLAQYSRKPGQSIKAWSRWVSEKATEVGAPIKPKSLENIYHRQQRAARNEQR